MCWKTWRKPRTRTRIDAMSTDQPLPEMSADELIQWLEARGFGWSLDHTGHMIEARIWDWPNVVARYRPAKVEPLARMIRAAMLGMTEEQLSRTPNG
jgi:hypothetical protein